MTSVKSRLLKLERARNKKENTTRIFLNDRESYQKAIENGETALLVIVPGLSKEDLECI